MNVEIGTETLIFVFWKYLLRNFGIFSLKCRSPSNHLRSQPNAGWRSSQILARVRMRAQEARVRTWPGRLPAPCLLQRLEADPGSAAVRLLLNYCPRSPPHLRRASLAPPILVVLNKKVTTFSKMSNLKFGLIQTRNLHQVLKQSAKSQTFIIG